MAKKESVFDIKTPIYIQVAALAVKHGLTEEQQHEWLNLSKSAYFMGNNNFLNALEKDSQTE